MDQVVETFKWCLVLLLALAVFDVSFARKFQGRYFVLHVLANTCITFCCLNDCYECLVRPIDTMRDREGSVIPLGFVFAIHFYHMIPFLGFTLHYVDWLHHILMVVIACPLLFFTGSGRLMNITFFFICGVPGGLDYLMLALVKENLMKPLAEKRYNNILQVWVRNPGIIVCVFMLFIQVQLHREHPDGLGITWTEIICRLLCGGITFWNGNYFMERVCGNYYVTAYKLRETVESNKKKERKDRINIDAWADEKNLRKKVLEDEVEEHPLPDSIQIPGHTRNIRLGALGKAWEFIRVGS